MRFARHHSRLICTKINMKFLIFPLVLVAVTSAQNYVGYNREVIGRPIAILRQAQDSSPEGSYNWSYETENGIAASEVGEPKAPGPEGPAVVAQGQYQYTAPDGTPIAVSYTADENGFHPQGAHIPVIPEAIKRSLEFNAAHPDSENNPQIKYQRF